MSSQSAALEQLVADTIAGLGFEYLGTRYVSQGKQTLLRIYIDIIEPSDKKGITVDDCAKVSRQVAAVLAAEAPEASDYPLEVSSPGADRPLFTLAHYQRFLGHKVHLKMKMPIEQQRNFTGVLKSATEQHVELTVEDKTITLPLEAIDKANLVTDFDEMRRWL